MKTVCEVLNVARSNIAVRTKAPLAKPLGRPPQPEADLLDEIKAVIGEMPTTAIVGSGLFCGAPPRHRVCNLLTTSASIGS